MYNLTLQDKILLMKNNIPLYMQYIVARYFTAKTSQEQLSWILEKELTEDSVTEIKTITLQEFDSDISFFPNPGIAHVYSLFAENIISHFPFPRNCNALIANLILYHIDDSISNQLQEPKKVEAMFEEAEDLLKFGCRYFDKAKVSHVNIATFIKTLKIMNEVFEKCIVRTEDNLMPRTIVIGYTDMEEMWLMSQFGQFQQQFLSVQPPLEYLQEGVDYIRTQRNTQKSFVPTWISMTTERITRVLKMHPGKSSHLICALHMSYGKSVTCISRSMQLGGLWSVLDCRSHQGIRQSIFFGV